MRMDKLVKTAKVALAAATFAIDRPYTYRVPDALAEKLVPGMRVLVPFGAGNRPSEGLVLSLADEFAKAIQNVYDETSVSEMLGVNPEF